MSTHAHGERCGFEVSERPLAGREYTRECALLRLGTLDAISFQPKEFGDCAASQAQPKTRTWVQRSPSLLSLPRLPAFSLLVRLSASTVLKAHSRTSWSSRSWRSK